MLQAFAVCAVGVFARPIGAAIFGHYGDRIGRKAALIAECFTLRLRYSGASLGYQLASVFAGGPAPLVTTALFAAYGSAYAIAVYILFSVVVSIVATAVLPDYTSRDISGEP